MWLQNMGLRKVWLQTMGLRKMWLPKMWVRNWMLRPLPLKSAKADCVPL